MKPYGPVSLELNPAKYFQDFFKEIEALPKSKDKSTVQKRLENKGMKLFEDLFPEDLRKLVWSARDSWVGIKDPVDPTWLAYTIFADPYATIKVPNLLELASDSINK